MNILTQTKLTNHVYKVHVDTNVFNASLSVLEIEDKDGVKNSYITMEQDSLKYIKFIDGVSIVLDIFKINVTGDILKARLTRINKHNFHLRYHNETHVFTKTFTLFDDVLIKTYETFQEFTGTDTYTDELHTLTFKQGLLKKHVKHNTINEITTQDVLPITTELFVTGENKVTFWNTPTERLVIDGDKKILLSPDSTIVQGLLVNYIITEDNNEVAINNT